MKTLNDIKDLEGKKVLLRVSFNAVEDNKITGTFRIESHKDTIDYLLDKGARICLVSHISKGGSFKEVVDDFSEIIGKEIKFIGDFDKEKVVREIEDSPLVLIDNIRHDKREKKDDEEFAKELAEPFDIYINDDFSTSHRKHTSMHAIAKYLPAYAGFVVEKEVGALSKAFDKSLERKVIVIGGAKTVVKTEVIKKYLEIADSVLIGGLVAVAFFKAKGFEVGISPVDEKALDNIKNVDLNNPQLVLPTDVMISETTSGKSGGKPFPAGDIDNTHAILDIGPESAEYFSDLIHHSQLVIWNGPMGLFEEKDFINGTKKVAQAVANSDGFSIVGGGESISFFEEEGLINKFDFVSTGGGAMLEYLAGKEMPGLGILK